MMTRAGRARLFLPAVAVVAMIAGCAKQETAEIADPAIEDRAVARTETSYNPRVPLIPRGRVERNEPDRSGIYAPKGIQADSGYALLSVRRNDREATPFFTALQREFTALTALPMNVAPTAPDLTLERQASIVTAKYPGLKFIVDCPDVAGAARFAMMARTIGRGVVLVTRSKDGFPPGVPVVRIDSDNAPPREVLKAAMRSVTQPGGEGTVVQIER